MQRFFSILFLGLVLLFSGCSMNDNDSAADSFSEIPGGQGGSWARFAVVQDYLMTVDTRNLNIINIADLNNPQPVKSVGIGERIETVFARDNSLFIGSQEGMYIWDVSQPENPEQLSFMAHRQFVDCPERSIDLRDPVVVDGNIAYLTLKEATGCALGGLGSQLIVFDVTNLDVPQVIGQYPMTAPGGLATFGDWVLVCDNDQQIVIFDRTDPHNLQEINRLDIPGYDIIPFTNSLLITAHDGFHQYELINGELQYVSSILVEN